MTGSHRSTGSPLPSWHLRVRLRRNTYVPWSDHAPLTSDSPLWDDPSRSLRPPRERGPLRTDLASTRSPRWPGACAASSLRSPFPHRLARGGSVSTPEDNIKIILADWLDSLSRHDLDAIEQRMAPEVFWQGIREDFVCEDRDEAMKMLREQQREEHGVEALELVATEVKVVLGVRSHQLQEVGGVPLGGQIFQVFTLRDGIIVRVDEYERRGEALAAAGADGRGDWQ